MSHPENKAIFDRMEKLVSDFCIAMAEEGYPMFEGHPSADKDEGMTVFLVSSFEALLEDKKVNAEKLQWLNKFNAAIAECYVAKFGGTYIRDYAEELSNTKTGHALRIIMAREDLIAVAGADNEKLVDFAKQAFDVAERVHIPLTGQDRQETVASFGKALGKMATQIRNSNEKSQPVLIRAANELLVQCCDKSAPACIEKNESAKFALQISEVRAALSEVKGKNRAAAKSAIEQINSIHIGSGLLPDTLSLQPNDPVAVANAASKGRTLFQHGMN